MLYIKVLTAMILSVILTFIGKNFIFHNFNEANNKGTLGGFHVNGMQSGHASYLVSILFILVSEFGIDHPAVLIFLALTLLILLDLITYYYFEHEHLKPLGHSCNDIFVGSCFGIVIGFAISMLM